MFASEVIMEIAKSPEQAIEILDRAFNEGDLETIMAFYDDAALVVPQPSVEARGKEAIREMYSKMLQPGVVAHQSRIRLLEADGIALFISHWSLSQPGQTEKAFVATTVLRQQDDGGWKAFIDNAQGPAILEG
jgi:ketosteroid isomerase-like protein